MAAERRARTNASEQDQDIPLCDCPRIAPVTCGADRVQPRTNAGDRRWHHACALSSCRGVDAPGQSSTIRQLSIGEGAMLRFRNILVRGYTVALFTAVSMASPLAADRKSTRLNFSH